nr:hypothetical protein [uncultured Chryseobacterium sp.]
MIKLIFFSFALFQLNFWNAQIQNISNKEFITRRYKNLDENFNIKMSSKNFNETINRYRFIRSSIQTYEDSLNVALINEFNDWTLTRKAFSRITFSWKKVGYELWLDEDEARSLGAKYKFKRAYELKLYVEEGKTQDVDLQKLIDNIRKKVYESSKDEASLTCSVHNLLNYAYTNNPQVINDRANYLINSRKNK